jgi:hypothetical protein
MLDPDQIKADALAIVNREIDRRPSWLSDQPVAVDHQTWRAARDEMASIQRDRGFPLAVAPIDQDNFLLRGIPVVIA